MLKRVLYKCRNKLCRAVIVPIEGNEVQQQKIKKKELLLRSTHTIKYRLFHFEETNLSSLTVPYRKTMESIQKQQFKPPSSVKGMMKLDRSKFDDVLKVPTITVPVKDLQKILKKLKKYGLKIKHLSPVVDLEKCHPNFGTHRRFLFDPRKLDLCNKLPETVQSVLERENSENAKVEIYDLKVSYENWNFHEVMQAIMPDDNDIVSGFSEVGHIAHFNLRDEVLPYKHIIGEVLLDKISTVRTVVNKLNSIDNTYRTFQMELLAGEENFVTRTKENSFVFEVDFAKVYWNSRLGTEHHRMTNGLSCTDIVFDVFAGIGPFAVPAAKKRANVFANDLNPYSYENLLKNIELNKCDSSLITCSNLDGREFINTIMKEKLKEIFTEGTDVANIHNISVLMNLPALAYTFLDAFNGILSEVDNFNMDAPLPIVNCYCFTNLTEATDKWDGDTNAELKHRVIDIIGSIQEDDLTLRHVRDVAPQKLMMCVSFKLTQEIMCGTVKQNKSNTEEIEVSTEVTEAITKKTEVSTEETEGSTDEPPAKYQKVETST